MKRLAFFLTFCGVSAAQATTPQNLLPSQDVMVTYQLEAPGRPLAIYQLQYDAAGQRARVNDTSRGTYFLLDLAGGRAQLVIPMMHTVVDAPRLASLSQEITQLHNARFTGLGPGRYAGLPCEKYLVVNAQGSADVCLTVDGVALSFHGQDAHGDATVTATDVAYGPQPADDFTAPAGFGSVTLPPGALEQLLRQQ